MFCEECGKEISDNTRFCPYCGAEQTARVQPAQSISFTSAVNSNADNSATATTPAETSVPVSTPVNAPVSTPVSNPVNAPISTPANAPAPNAENFSPMLKSVEIKDDPAPSPKLKYSLKHLVLCLAAAGVMAIAAGVFAGMYFALLYS